MTVIGTARLFLLFVLRIGAVNLYDLLCIIIPRRIDILSFILAAGEMLPLIYPAPISINLCPFTVVAALRNKDTSSQIPRLQLRLFARRFSKHKTRDCFQNGDQGWRPLILRTRAYDHEYLLPTAVKD